MKILYIIIIFIFIIGCSERVEHVKYYSKGSFDVEYLFTCENIKIYRFRDGGCYHYFSMGKGKMINDIVKISNGKQIHTYDDSVIDLEEKEIKWDKD